MATVGRSAAEPGKQRTAAAATRIKPKRRGWGCETHMTVPRKMPDAPTSVGHQRLRALGEPTAASDQTAMHNAIQLISDGDGLAVIGDQVDKFLESKGLLASSRQINLRRLKPRERSRTVCGPANPCARGRRATCDEVPEQARHAGSPARRGCLRRSSTSPATAETRTQGDLVFRDLGQALLDAGSLGTLPAPVGR